MNRFTLLSILFFTCISLSFSQDKEQSEVLDFAEEMPEFENGGINELRKQVQMRFDIPSSFIQNQELPERGMILTRFVVNKEGTIENIEVVKGIEGCSECDRAAVHAIESIRGKFTPAMQGGKQVSVYYTLPIVIHVDRPKEVEEEKPTPKARIRQMR